MIPSSSEKRTQRTPFYCEVLRDTSRSKKQWYVKTVLRTETGQTRKREFFELKREAVAAKELKIRTHAIDGERALEISTELKGEAIKAAAILAGRASIVQAAEYYVKHALSKGGDQKLSDVVEKYIAWQKQEGASDAYITDLSWRLKRLAKRVAGKLRDLTWPKLTSYLDSLNLKVKGRRNEMRNIRPMLNWAVDQQIIEKSPFPAEAFKGRKKDKAALVNVRILSLEEIGLLLKNAGPFLPHVIFGLFVGARPDETKGLMWSDVDWTNEQVTLNNQLLGNQSSTHHRRTVPMSKNALQSLEGYRSAVGLVSPAKHYITRLRNAGKHAGLSPWPVDCLRHSFASYWMQKHKNENLLKEIMGHHESSDMLRKHYLNRGISTEQAESYWTLVP